MSCIVTTKPPAPHAPCMRALALSYDRALGIHFQRQVHFQNRVISGRKPGRQMGANCAHRVPAGTSRVCCTPRQEGLGLRYFCGLFEGPTHGHSIHAAAAAVRRRQWPCLEAPPPLVRPASGRQCLVAHLCRRAS